jgi:hypothetical protein
MNQTPGQGVQFRTHSAGVARPTLNEFADQFETAIRESRALALLYQQAQQEITSLREQLDEVSKRSQKPTVDDGRNLSLLDARERLIRDEFERKFQELSVLVKAQRKKHAEQVSNMKQQMANCICGASNHKR